MIHVHGRGEWQGEVHLYEEGGGRGMVREEGREGQGDAKESNTRNAMYI